MILRNYVFVTSHGTRQDRHYLCFLIIFFFFSLFFFLALSPYRLPPSLLISVQLILLLLSSLPPLVQLVSSKGGYTLVTLPRIVTPYRDSVDGTRDRITYQKLVTR